MAEAAMSKTLLLVPTELELSRMVTGVPCDTGRFQAEICGFGPVASAARTAQLIEQLAPRHVILAGIAGTLDETKLAIGRAAVFREVAIDGIGIGCGSEFVSATSMGFPHWPGGQPKGPRIDDRIQLQAYDRLPSAELLLTCCAASATPDKAEDRRKRFPESVAEDMEGFAVALACTLAGVRLTIVRGISNLAGQRDKSMWQIDDALQAAGQLVQQVIEQMTREPLT